jgi:four helix bundle protein
MRGYCADGYKQLQKSDTTFRDCKPMPIIDDTNNAELCIEEFTKQRAGYFDHERWDVYIASLELVVLISNIVEHFPRGKKYLADQLQRAGASVPLNIAEGAGENSLSEKARFYRIAKRSATESSSVFDICLQLRIIDEQEYNRGRKLLLRIVAMLTKMARIAGGGK